jgi:peptide/nickel transport system substrate-binding protein
MIKLNRRQTLALGGATFLSELLLGDFASAQTSDALTIAYNVNLPSFDPTVGPSAVNPTIQAIYRAIYDQYVGQNPDLSFAPGLLTKWGWNDDKTKAWMDVREGVFWHDGSPLTPADVVWSLERAGDPKTGNPIQFVWGGLDNYHIAGNRVTADVKQFDPTVSNGWRS